MKNKQYQTVRSTQIQNLNEKQTISDCQIKADQTISDCQIKQYHTVRSNNIRLSDQSRSNNIRLSDQTISYCQIKADPKNLNEKQTISDCRIKNLNEKQTISDCQIKADPKSK